MDYASGTPGVATLNLGLIALIPPGSIQMHVAGHSPEPVLNCRTTRAILTTAQELFWQVVEPSNLFVTSSRSWFLQNPIENGSNGFMGQGVANRSLAESPMVQATASCQKILATYRKWQANSHISTGLGQWHPRRDKAPTVPPRPPIEVAILRIDQRTGTVELVIPAKAMIGHRSRSP